jgi:RNA polymerase sigma-70 factor (ECF subfamily)
MGGDGTSFWGAVPDRSDAERTWEAEWQQAAMIQCLEQVRREVSPPTFEAFRLVVFEQVEPAAAAARLGLTRNAVFIAKHRVASRMRELREAMELDE